MECVGYESLSSWATMLPGASNMLTAEGPHLRTQSSFTSIPHGTKHLPILQAMKFCAASLPSSGCSCSGRPTGDAYLSSSSTSRRAELRKPPVCLLAPQLVRCDASRSSAATCRVATLSQASIDGVSPRNDLLNVFANASSICLKMLLPWTVKRT